MAKFGLIGKNIDYSFSRAYFSEKFQKEQLDHSYVNFDIATIEQFKDILEQEPEVAGFNVTIPIQGSHYPLSR